MTKGPNLTFLIVLALVSSSCFSRAHSQDRAVIEGVKEVCYLAEVSGTDQRYATAFCVHPSGIVVTNFHVVDQLKIGGTINVIANSGEPDQKSLQARLLRTDEKNDLAVLKILEEGNYKAVEIAESPELYETLGVIAFGFPFGKSLSLEENTFPTISVNSGRITAIRKDKTEAQLVQLDATLNPGNSGGPVVDHSGKLIGVVSFGVAGAGVNFAIPSEKLRKLLSKPDLELNVPEITNANFAVPKNVEITITPLIEEILEPSVEFWVKRGDAPAKKFILSSASPNKYRGTVVGEVDNTRKMLNGEIEFKQGKIEGKIQDEVFSIDGKEVHLAHVGSFSPSKETDRMDLSMLNGSSRKIDIQAMPKLKVDLGGFSLTVDVASVSKVTFQPDESDVKISYMVIVKSAGKEITRWSGAELEKASDIAADNQNNVFPDLEAKLAVPVFQGEPKTIPMPGTITDAVLARGGQYLLLVLGVEKKLVVVNIGKGSLEKILPLASDDVLVAGTMNHILLLDRKKNVVERYGLDNFSRQVAVKTPFSGVVKSITAGCASNGPVLVHRSEGTDDLARTAFTAVDLIKLKELPIPSDGSSGHYSSYRDIIHVRASHQGRVFGMWATSHSPSGMQSLVLTDSRMLTKYEHTSAGHVVPNADGSHILSGAGIFSTGLKRISKGSATGGMEHSFFPTSHPRFVLSLAHMNDAQRGVMGANIHEIGSDAALFQLPDLKLAAAGNAEEGWVRHDLTLDKRIYLNLESHALVSVPFTNDGVVVQEFDLRRELRNSELDYFFVSSTPNRICVPGKTYSYQIDVESNRQDFKFEIASGPEKMTVSPKGKVTWSVPRDFKDESVDVIVSISNGESMQTYDSFTIYNAAIVGKSK